MLFKFQVLNKMNNITNYTCHENIKTFCIDIFLDRQRSYISVKKLLLINFVLRIKIHTIC